MENFGESQLFREVEHGPMHSTLFRVFCRGSSSRIPCYQDEWDADIGEVLQYLVQYRRETGNRHDPHAVATLGDGRIIGHVPQKSLPVCSILIRHGGSITCTVRYHRCYSADLV